MRVSLLCIWMAILVYSGARAEPGGGCIAHVHQSIDALAAGDFPTARKYFDAELARTHDEERLKNDWGRLESSEGKYMGRAAGRVVLIEARRYIFVALQFVNGPFEAHAACDKDGLISLLEGGIPSDAPTKIKNAKLEIEPSGVRREPVVVASAYGPLPGTLTLPAGPGRFPSVLIVAGAGQNDADGTYGPNKIYLDLAEGLAAQGVASLRYDKNVRAYTAQIGLSEYFTVDDEVTRDAVTASNLLHRNAHIDLRRQFLLGHSLGAMMAPEIASRFPGLAGLILMAPPGQPILDNAVNQTRYILEAQHAASDQIDAAIKAIRDEQSVLRAAGTSRPLAGEFSGMQQSYWQSLFRYDPIVWAEKSSLPTLIVQGERDYRVEPRYALARWKAVFAGNPRVQIELYPGLNHFFMPIGDLPPPRDEEVPAHVDDQVIHDIAAWIRSVRPTRAER
jgi:uncharacterized protein